MAKTTKNHPQPAPEIVETLGMLIEWSLNQERALLVEAHEAEAGENGSGAIGLAEANGMKALREKIETVRERGFELAVRA